jgi:hypothetical protein
LPHIQTSPRASMAAPYFSWITRSYTGVAPRAAIGVGRLTTLTAASGESVRYSFVPHASGVKGGAAPKRRAGRAAATALGRGGGAESSLRI